jgi:predicted lipoprotein
MGGLFDDMVGGVQIEYSQFYNLFQNFVEEHAIQKFQMSLTDLAGSSVACTGAYSLLTTLRLLSSGRCHTPARPWLLPS